MKRSPGNNGLSRGSAWLPLLWLVVTGLGIALLVLLWDFVPYIVAGTLVGSFALWILVSTLWPSRPDRTCPRCKAEGLVKIRRGQPGVHCERCGFRDEQMHVAYLDDW